MHRTACILALCSLLILTPWARGPLRADGDTRELEIAGVRIPCYGPTWGGEHPLRLLTERLEADESSAVMAALDRVATGLDGRLLPPLAEPRSERFPRIGPAEEVLGTWAAGLAGLELRAGGVPRADHRRALSGGDRTLWDPAARDVAQRRLEIAVADGRFGDALRLLASPNQPRVTPELETWLRQHLGDAATPAGQTPGWHSCAPTATQATSLPARLPHELRMVYQLSDGPEAPERFLRPVTGEPPELDAADLRDLPRRVPLGAIYPLVSEDRLLLPIGSELLVFQHTGSPRLVSTQLLGPTRHAGLLHLPVMPVATSHSLVVRARTGQTQHASTFFYTYGRDGAWKPPVFNRPALLDPVTLLELDATRPDAGGALSLSFSEYTLFGSDLSISITGAHTGASSRFDLIGLGASTARAQARFGIIAPSATVSGIVASKRTVALPPLAASEPGSVQRTSAGVQVGHKTPPSRGVMLLA